MAYVLTPCVMHAALQLSVEEGAKESTSQSGQTDMSNLLADQSFVSSIIASVRYLNSCYFNPPFVNTIMIKAYVQSCITSFDTATRHGPDRKKMGGL